jgi:glucose/arabinose dehydrogenase
LQPHSAPLGLAFDEGSQFPAAWKGDAFVALHGSAAGRVGAISIRTAVFDVNI